MIYQAIKITDGIEKVIDEALSIEYLINKYSHILNTDSDKIIFKLKP